MTRATAGALTALAVVLVLAGCGSGQAEPTPPRAAPTVTATPTPAPTSTVDVPIAAATQAPVRNPQPPVRVVAASVDVDVPVVPVGVETGGFMELPVDPAIAGWYRFGSDPASPDGNVVISAHVDAPAYPIGPFSRLRDLAAGEVVEVTDAAGAAHRYSVESVTYYPKADLPVSELFARAGTRDLVLITCGGAFDSTTGRYADNVVAIATPIP
ncbi:class F sortase [Microbacterium atlanticum]|uniref:class F sortase n=1 Tax=Microbacterium atlanticum TaxID=2782168 RepID=UPI0018887153|nr:class F sortase [Microbacterium atlanticum]